MLAAWRDSPTRFREDANAEDDLRVGGYRDRLLVELAQNAADAAVLGGEPGRLWLRVLTTPAGAELRAANTGAPLDAAGVAALASLRASAKRAGHQVGRFGVGFAAVLAVTEAPRVLSTSGGVRFSAGDTREAIAGHDRLAELLAERGAEVPVLRLVWPTEPAEEPVPAGYRTEVRLPLRAGVDPAELLDGAAADAADLLLALPGLAELTVGERRWTRAEDPDGTVTITGPDGEPTRWLTRRAAGTLTEEQTSALGAEARNRPEWSVCWAVSRSGPLGNDVLYAPTPTDERLSLPARLFATLPVEPNRRRLLPGPATDAVLAAAIEEYVRLVADTPAAERTDLVPLPGFPLSEVDEQLRAGITGRLAATTWLPAASGPDLAPAGAAVLDVPDAELAELLTGLIPGLLAPWLAESRHAKALAALGVRRLRPVELVEAVSGVDRSPEWWRRLYGALVRLPDPGSALTEELGALPVPLIDGRTVLGPRDVLLPTAELGELRELLTGLDIAGLRIAHPDAVHPLLDRLGARPADAADLLTAPAVQDAVRRSVADARAGLAVDELADTVLRLVETTNVGLDEVPWLGELALPDADGEPRRAAELVLPDSDLLGVLDREALGADGPLAVLAEEVAADWSVGVLRSVGVLDNFALLVDEQPAGPDHDLPDEAEWWSWLAVAPGREPAVLVAVRDLDLVDADAWPEALRLLASQPETRRAMADARGYTAWWLARYADLAGAPPLDWRLADAEELTGLFDPLPALGLPEHLLVDIGVRADLTVTDRDQAEDLLDRLADPDREMTVGLAMRAHAVLAEAALTEVFDPALVDPPEYLRALSGTVVAAGDAVVLDRPWLLQVLDEARVVAAGPGHEEALADLLNVPLASEIVTARPESAGDEVAWGELGAVRLACGLLHVLPPEGTVVVHDELVVDGRRVSWWLDGDLPHAEDTPEGLARALAWITDSWPDRYQLTALITDPTPTTALS